MTDGKIGTLSSSDFLDWSLTLYDGVGTATINPSNSVLDISPIDNVTATAPDPTSPWWLQDRGYLWFNFNSDGGFMSFLNPTTCAPEWSFETGGPGTGCNGRLRNAMSVSAVAAGYQVSLESGEVTFAQTPEPSSFAELGLSVLGMLGFVQIRRRTVR